MEKDELLQTILRAIRNLRFGTLEIVVHDSRVVRIERHERIRLDIDSETQPHTGGTNLSPTGLTVKSEDRVLEQK